MELEHLIVHEAPRSPIFSGAAGADTPSLCAFFMTLQETRPRHHSSDTGYDATPHEHHRADDKARTRGAPGLVPSDRSPDYHVGHPKKGVSQLQAWRADQEATVPEHNLRKQKLTQRQCAQPPVGNNN